MSCSGKTTFAKQLDVPYICFDALFPWHQIETFGMSITSALGYVAKKCSDQFVLDGWHTADLKGNYLPSCTVYVIYTEYNRVLRQYPRQALHHLEYFPMFKKWYSYASIESRYFYNQGDDFIETNLQDYCNFVSNEFVKHCLPKHNQ